MASSFDSMMCPKCKLVRCECVRHAARNEALEIQRSQEEVLSAEARFLDGETHARRSAFTGGAGSEILITTTPGFDGYVITNHLGIVAADCAVGMNIFRDLFSAVRDGFGGRSHTVQNALKSARESCLLELKADAKLRKANAIVGVKFDYSQLSGQGLSMLFLVATGTAVTIVPQESVEADTR